MTSRSSWEAVARQFGVSSNAVRKRLRMRSIALPESGAKRFISSGQPVPPDLIP